MTANIFSRLQQVREICNEQLQTAQAVKGDAFANVAATLTEIHQVVLMIGALCARAEMPEAERDLYIEAATMLLSSIAETVAQGLSPEDAAEVTNLASQMGDRFETLIEG